MTSHRLPACATRVFATSLFVASAAAIHLGLPANAAACGGCFQPTTSVSSVDAHRMALALSPRGSVLWDQIAYTGNPGDFVWVLPVASGAVVELADNGFFEALQQGTTISLQAPIPPRTFCSDPCGDSPFGFSSAAPEGRDFDGGGVMVYHQGVVGPYETATIGSEDPYALRDWLVEHGYGIDRTLLPTLAHYASQGLSFAVLRLRPGEGVDRMQPVRVASPGLASTLPLRMVAAGVTTTVDLELYVFAESRIEAANFGNAEVDRGSISYDWATGTFDYEARFDDALFSGRSGANWVTEYAWPVGAGGSAARIGFGRLSETATAHVGWTQLTGYRSTGGDGVVHTAAEDTAVVRALLPAEAYLTRLRTRLQVSQLGTDLDLIASEAGDIGTFVDVTRERNRAPEPSCPSTCAPGAGVDPAGTARGGSGLCSVSGRGERGLWAAWLGVGLLALLRRRR